MGDHGGQGSKTEQSENTAGTLMAPASNRPVRSFKGAVLVGAEIKGVGAGGNGRVRKSGLGEYPPSNSLRAEGKQTTPRKGLDLSCPWMEKRQKGR